MCFCVCCVLKGVMEPLPLLVVCLLALGFYGFLCLGHET